MLSGSCRCPLPVHGAQREALTVEAWPVQPTTRSCQSTVRPGKQLTPESALTPLQPPCATSPTEGPQHRSFEDYYCYVQPE